MKDLPLSTAQIRRLLRNGLGKLPKRTWAWNKKTPGLPPLQKDNGKGHAYELLCLVDLAKRLCSRGLQLRFAGGDILHFNQNPGDLDVRLSYLVVHRGGMALGVLALDILCYQSFPISTSDPLHLNRHESDVVFCRVTDGPDTRGKIKVPTSDVVVSVFCKNKPWNKADYREFAGLVSVQSGFNGNAATVRLRQQLNGIFGVRLLFTWVGTWFSPISAFASPTIPQSEVRQVLYTFVFLMRIRS